MPTALGVGTLADMSAGTWHIVQTFMLVIVLLDGKVYPFDPLRLSEFVDWAVHEGFGGAGVAQAVEIV